MHPKWGANKDFKRVDSDKCRGPHGGSERSNIRNRGRSDFRGIDLDGYGEIYKKCRRPNLSNDNGVRSRNKLNSNPLERRVIHSSGRVDLESHGGTHSSIRRSSDSHSRANGNFKKVDLNNYGEIYKKCKRRGMNKDGGMRPENNSDKVDKEKKTNKSVKDNRSDPSWNSFFNS